MSFEDYLREEIKKEFREYEKKRMSELLDDILREWGLIGDTHDNSDTGD